MATAQRAEPGGTVHPSAHLLAGGDDGSRPASAVDFIGSLDAKTSLYSLLDVTDVNPLCLPGLADPALASARVAVLSAADQLCAPKCRQDHRLKQHPRWKAAQLPDGTFRWTTPSGRTYTTEPTRYPSKRHKAKLRSITSGSAPAGSQGWDASE